MEQQNKLIQDNDIKSLVDRIKALKVSLKALNSSYEKLVKNLFQVLTKNEVVNRQEEMNSLNKELNNVLNNERIINEEIKALSTNINIKAIEIIVKAQEQIRNEYINANKGLDIAFGLDGKPIKVKNKERYDNLCLLANILKEPLQDMEVIQGLAVVNKNRKEEVLSLLEKVGLKSSSLVKEEIPKILSDNDKLMKNLENYLDSLAKKISDYVGMTGLPIKETKQIEDKKWVVLATDVDECNLIIEIMNILRVSKSDTVKVWNIADIKKDLVGNFKRYANGTKYFSNIIPKIPENEKEIENIKVRLGELIRKAKENNSEELILPDNKREYNLLNKKYTYLMSAQAGDNLVPYGNVMLEPKYVINYQDIEKELQIFKDNDKIKQENADNGLVQERIQKRVLEFNSMIPDEKGLVRINKEQDV